MCQICMTTGSANCRNALATEDTLRERITNRVTTMKLFASLLFGLFLSSFRDASGFDTFEGATIALAHLIITGSALESTTILRRRLSFLSSVVFILDATKCRWTTNRKEQTDYDTLDAMDAIFEGLIESLDDLITAEIKDEVESQFETFGAGQWLDHEEEEDIKFQPFLDLTIAERVAEAEAILLDHLEALAKEDEEKRDRRFAESELSVEEQKANQEAIANLPADREIVLLTEDDIYGS